MLKFLSFLLIAVVSYSDEFSNALFDCNNGNNDACAFVGGEYMNRFSPNYNPDRAIYPLKKSCIQGNNENSCLLLSRYYLDKRDDISRLLYLKKSCNLGNDISCYIVNGRRN